MARVTRLLVFIQDDRAIPIHLPGAVEPHITLAPGVPGSSLFSGVSPQIPGVSYSFTSLFRRASYFPGIPLKLLIILVFTRFSRSSFQFHGVLYLSHQFPLKLVFRRFHRFYRFLRSDSKSFHQPSELLLCQRPYFFHITRRLELAFR